MTTNLITSNWYTRFEEAIRFAKEEILLVAPYIHLKPLRPLLARTDVPVRVLTRHLKVIRWRRRPTSSPDVYRHAR